MSRTSPDAALIGITAEDILAALKRARRGEPPGGPKGVDHILRRAGLTDEDGDVTSAGQALHKRRWVLGDADGASEAVGRALRPLLPVQVIEQELRGFPAVPEDGVLELLQVHRAAPADLTVDDLRPTLRHWNELGVLVYSRKTKSVRVGRLPDENEAAPGEDDRIAVLVSPQTPYSNVVRLRRILRRLRGTVYWVDKHFNARAFEDLIDEIDSDAVDEVRILSGSADNVLTSKSFRDYGRFEEEMSNRGVVSEWRVAASDIAADLHDRWLLDDKSRYNLPPVNSFYKGQYSEILQTESDPPVSEWWEASAGRTQ